MRNNGVVNEVSGIWFVVCGVIVRVVVEEVGLVVVILFVYVIRL